MPDKVSNTVICPYCCYRFKLDEADFRLSQPLNRAQKKTDLVKDEKLFHYYTEILGIESKEAAKLSMQYAVVSINSQNVSFDEQEVQQYGFVQSIAYTTNDGIKITVDKRLCPFCHNELPVGYGLRETVLISILGDAHAGKSVYITMLIDELQNNKDFVSKLSFIGNSQSKEMIYESYQKPLLKEHRLIESTRRTKIPPFSYNYWYQYKDENGITHENTIDIIFYDIAGEDLHNVEDMKKNGFNIKNSSGLIFILDPTNFKKMEELFMLEDIKLIESIPEENSAKNIFTAMYNYFLGMQTEKSDIPLALVISKTDLFRNIDMNFFKNRPESRIQKLLDNEGNKGYFDMKSARSLNYEVRELLEYVDEEPVLNYALGGFKYVQCFAVSSLGKKPVEDADGLYYTDGDITPFRVKEPFYWILYKRGLFAKIEEAEVREESSELKPVAPKSIFSQIADVFIEFFRRRKNK